MPPNPWVIAAALAALVLSAALGGYGGYRLAEASCLRAEAGRQALRAEVREENAALADQVAMDTAAAIAGIRVTQKTVNNEVRHEREVLREVLENPDCSLPASTGRLLNRARGRGDGGEGAGGASPAVPADGGGR